MVPRPAHLRDPPSDEELLPEEDWRHLAYMRLKRYCYLGTFEPVRKHLELPNVGKIYELLNKYSCKMDPKKMLSILNPANKAKLFRRDEVTLLHVTYLLGGTDLKYKTKLREEFVNLCKTDADLFLFCKYAAAVHKHLKKPIFCKTIKKAITGWYVSKSSKELSDMFRTSRGRNGFSHGALIKLCRISDHTLGSKYIYDCFNKTSTSLIAMRTKSLPPPPAPKAVKRRFVVASNVTVMSSTSLISNATTMTSDTTTITSTETTTVRSAAIPTKEAKPLLPPKECNPEQVRAQVLAISELRTEVELDAAIKLVDEFQLHFEHLPPKLLQHSAILNKVIPRMSCEQLLECFHAPKVRKHFIKKDVIEVCRQKFQTPDALKDEDIDPIMCLINLDNLNVSEPIKPTNNKKTNRGRMVHFSKILFRNSFKNTKPMNLNIHITINMQGLYMKKILKNTKTIAYKHAAIALAFTFFKAEENCDVFRWCENEHQLLPVEFKKNYHYADAFNETFKVINSKTKQHLWLPIVEAHKQKDTKKYDLFICIVPAATRGNKKHCSGNLVEYLNKYRRGVNSRAKLVMVDLCRYRKSMRYAKTSCENILEICGLDVHTVSVIRNFAVGNFD